ncbi:MULTISPECIES: hypothetical protein [Chitinophagaceae]
MQKILLVLLYLCIGYLSVAAQEKIKKYYDYDWKPAVPPYARFYSSIEKTDSGYRREDYYIQEGRVQMIGLYEDDSCTIPNGLFAYFYPSGKVSKSGKYVHGKKEGLWTEVYEEGHWKDSTVFLHDHPIGTSLGFYENGYIRDSVVTDEVGNVIYVSWFENGSVNSTGRYVQWSVPVMTWLFYHANGQLASKEKYANGFLVDKKYFDEQGNVMDTTNRDRDADFPGGEKEWKKYITKRLYFPTQYRITNADSAATVIGWTVSMDGSISNIEVLVPFAPAFDKIVVNIVKNCKTKWIPAIQHNRYVPFQERQKVTFNQTVN